MNEKYILDIEYVSPADAKDFTTIKISCKVKGIFYPKNQKELIFLIKFLSKHNIKYKLVGNGSNLLFSENAKNLIIISTKKLRKSITIDKNIINVSCGVMLSEVFKFCIEHGLSGFEKLAGIPATIGGAIINNAGAFNINISDNLVSIKVLQENKLKTLKKDQITFDYRKSDLKDCIILSAKFSLIEKNRCEIEKEYLDTVLLRNLKQPKGLSFGSVFKNPPNISAGYLIDKCKLKGFKYGGAEISQKHANFIINNKNATYSDIKYLIDLAKNKVFEQFDIILEEEIEII